MSELSEHERAFAQEVADRTVRTFFAQLSQKAGSSILEKLLWIACGVLLYFAFGAHFKLP